jgi:hypothetical protein
MILAKTVLNRHSLNGKRQDREKNCSLSTISSIARENSDLKYAAEIRCPIYT